MLVFPLVSVASIGWIPYYRKFAHFPKGPARTAILDESAWKKRKGYDLLFYTGNLTPSADLFSAANEVPFRNYLKKRDYRGAIALWDVKLNVPAAGSPTIVAESLTEQEQIGYTAARLLVFRNRILTYPMKGDGEQDGGSQPTAGGVQFTHRVKFRVGWKANFGARMLFGYDVPYVWMRVTYQVDFGGAAFTAIDACKLGVSVAGTYVPSQQHWAEAFAGRPANLLPTPPPPSGNSHSMENNDGPRLRDVFENPAPQAALFFLCQVEYEWAPLSAQWVPTGRSTMEGLP